MGGGFLFAALHYSSCHVNHHPLSTFAIFFIVTIFLSSMMLSSPLVAKLQLLPLLDDILEV